MRNNVSEEYGAPKGAFLVLDYGWLPIFSEAGKWSDEFRHNLRKLISINVIGLDIRPTTT